MYSLSKPQKSIYNMEKFGGDSISVICGYAMFNDVYDLNLLEASLNELYRLNDALRMRIVESAGEVSQYVSEFEYKKIEVLHFSGKDELEEYVRNFAKEPMDLSGSLFDAKIVVCQGDMGLILKLHHIVGDAWSCSVMETQLRQILKGITPEAFSYLDYLEKEKEYLNSKRYQRDLQYFENQIKQCEKITLLSEKQAKSLAAKRKTFTIDKNKTKLIADYAAKNNSTVYSVFMNVISVYISRVKDNAERFFIGTPVLNRTSHKDMNTVGTFINTVPFPVTLDSEKTFSQNLGITTENSIDIFRHERFNYSDLLEKYRNAFNFGDKLYDVAFSYQNVKVKDFEKMSQWFSCGMQPESLQIHIYDRNDEGYYTVDYDYQTEKFSDSEIERMHEHIINLLFDAIENDSKKLYELNLLPKEEKENLLHNFNNTTTAYPQDKSIYELFENSVAGRENSVCIETAERAITFGAFKKAVEALDFAIGKKTEGKNNVIAIIANRSVEMYIAIYAAIRGGNAYMPILPDYPEDRIGFMLKDSNAALVLAQSEFKSSAGDLPCIDISAFDYGKVDDSPRACNSAPDDAAYVIYTSGSTGTPKGSIISNKSAINRILWMQKAYSLDENSVILQKTPYTFDVSVWELFWWGISKGHLAPMKPDGHFMPAEILEDCKRFSVTHLHFVPSVFDLFVSFLEMHGEKLKSLDSVKHIFLSGEALSAELVNRFYALLPDSSIKLHNLYGPTECAVDVTYYDCKKEETNPVPIGKPIDNTQIYIVDSYMNIVPAEVQGELCIGGANVGMGYLNRPELTAQKFVDNPFGEGKLYKTGDLAYWREDGEIVFCGRKDFQVKLNGQRVELGEIEAVILQYKAITSAAVVLRKHKEKDILVAFYSGEEALGNELKAFCREKLPSYMVPSGFVRLEKLPLNSSGKLDRKQLSAIELPSFELTQKLEAPIDETEKLICDAFRAVLKADKIDRNTDFYDAGGTSLDTIRLLYDDSFSGITASDLMVNSTPAKLAAFLKKRTASSFKYLQRLVVNENSKKAIILFPFAGGSSAAFSALTHELNEIVDSLSLYAVDYPKNSQDCKEIAEEIIQLSQVSEISFYAHCAGVSIALQVAEIIEKSDKSVVKSFIAGGNIPFEKPMKFNVWSAVPYPFITAFLKKAGSVLTELPKEIQKKSLEDFRRHTTFAYEYFRVPGHKINAPIYVIISKEDLFTRNYKDAERNWSIYTNGPVSVDFIEGKSHYFQSDKPKELAKMIADIIG